MLRRAVLLLGSLFLVLGIYLCLKGVGHGGIQALVLGAVILIGTMFERWRYKNRNADVSGDWQPTGERFVDPETGKNVEVLYDPQSGERRYRQT